MIKLGDVTAILFTSSRAIAEGSDRTVGEAVCWGRNEGACGGTDTRPIDFPPISLWFDCYSGGHSGFDPEYACQQICGASVGPQCEIDTKRWGAARGYRWAFVACSTMGLIQAHKR